MNKFLFFLSVILSTSVFAKKVKFAVDMTGQTISAFGVHVAGDFQVLAGYPMDWDFGSTSLSQEGSTDIYSIVVDIPAFRKYEFKFVNGDQGYETEYVPDEVRVSYNFNDNRWMYVDSLANDTTFIGAVQFGLSSPASKFAVRYKVDMSSVLVSTNGVHTSTNYNLFSTVKNAMITFTDNPMPNVYEVINYVNAGTYDFNFINGNSVGGKEPSVPANCSNTGVRYVTVSKDTVFPEVCFNYCVNCSSVGIKENKLNGNSFSIYPNPAKSTLNIVSTKEEISEIAIYNVTGQKVLGIENILSQSYLIDHLDLPTGMYVVKVFNGDMSSQNIKLIIE